MIVILVVFSSLPMTVFGAENQDNSNDECFGVTLATISKYTPEEFYKDKKLFEDYDELGEYYDRHICRPMKNLMFDEKNQKN